MNTTRLAASFGTRALCTLTLLATACGSAASPAQPDDGVGDADDTATGGTSGTSGGGAGSGGTPGGSGGTGGSPTNRADAAAGGGGSGMPGREDAGADAMAPPADDARPADGGPPPGNRVLFYTRSTAFRHESIETAGMALRNLLMTIGVQSDSSANPAVLTAANLARYAGVVLINTNGKPFGDPGTTQIAALVDFVRGGGGLVGFHAASSTEYGATGPFAALLGGDTAGQPGGFRRANCAPEGQSPAATGLPTPFVVNNEEFYVFNNLHAGNQVVLRCDAAVVGGEKIPIAWQREEGAGRVFYSGLGHWREMSINGTLFLMEHAWPGLRWAIGRAP